MCAAANKIRDISYSYIQVELLISQTELELSRNHFLISQIELEISLNEWVMSHIQ